MKNILYIHDAQFIGGVERVLLGIFKAIDRTKFTPYFIGSKWNDGHFIKLVRKLSVECKTTNIKPFSRTYNPFILIMYFFNLLISSLAICNFIHKNNIDIISTNSLHDTFYVFIPALVMRKPIIWHGHAIRPIDAFRRFIISILDIKTKKYIAVSKAVKENLCLLGVNNRKIDVLYNAIDLGKFSSDKRNLYYFHKIYNLEEGVKLIGLVSQFQPGKGHEDFLEAAKIVSNKHKNVKFLIVGKKLPSEYFIKIESLVETLKLTEKVIFTDWIEDVEKLFFSLYVLVQPTYIEEACGVVLLEAMASEVPVIATKSGGMQEIVNDGIYGFLVNKNDPKSIAEKLLFLLDNPAVAKDMGQRGREIIKENFNLSKIIKKFEIIYEKL